MSEISEQSERSNLLTNRRVYYRLQMRSVCYVELGDRNGGVMLNLSEGGFTLQAAEVLAHNRFPRMRFRLPKSERWIEAAGKVIWHGKSGKDAGIQFVDLPDEVHQLIRDWMFAQTFAEERASGKKVGFRPALEREAALGPTASFPRPPVASASTGSEWAGFFPNESELPEKASAPASKIESHADSFFPEESKLPLSQPLAESTPAARIEPQERAMSAPAIDVPVFAIAQVPTVENPVSVGFPVKPREQVQISNAEPTKPNIEDSENRRQDSRNAAVSDTAKRIPFSEALSRSLASKSNYLSAYGSEPAKSSRTSWFLTAVIAFVAGLGFAWLITFGPLDFIRADIHQRLSTANTSVLAPAPGSVAGENAPKPPDIFSQPAAVAATHNADTPQNPQPEDTPAPPSRKVPTHSRASQPLLDENSEQTESSPVSPSVRLTPGVPAGYVASNSHFLSIRRAPGSHENSDQTAGSVRIGQLIYSPQAIYPEEALRLHVEGIVKLHAIIGEDGTIRTVSSASGPSVLVAAATKAVRDWRYEPTLIGTMPIESEREITFVFSL